MILEEIRKLFQGAQEGVWLSVVLYAVLLLSFLVGAVCKNCGLFAALSWAGIGGACLYGTAKGLQARPLVLLLSFSAVVSGVAYALLYGILRLQRVVYLRKKQRAERAKRVQYTLPDRENSYVRARLQTALREAPPKELEVDKRNVGVRLGYAKRMLSKVKGAPLSPVERLDVEEMAGLVASYTQTEGWSSEDMKVLGEVLARLIKLSAKYEIAV